MNNTNGNIWRRLIDRQIVLLVLLILSFLIMTLWLGSTLFPFFAAMVLAYLMDGMVVFLERRRIPRLVAVLIVFGLFLAGFFALFLWLIPMVVNQITNLVVEVPRIANNAQTFMLEIQEKYITGLNSNYLEQLIPRVAREMEIKLGQVATHLLGYIPGIISLFIYLILVPFLVLFFLKDKARILAWLSNFIPRDRSSLLVQVLRDIDRQIGNYIQGKFWEILIMGVSSSLAFLMLDTRFAILLGLLTGLSTLVPYLGVAVVTLPVAFLAFAQWGFFTWPSMKPIIAYAVLQLIDGTILAPVILGVSVRLHPTAIVLAILICGYIWGYWGLVFAVPIFAGLKSLLDYAFPYLKGDGPYAPPEEDTQDSAQKTGQL